MPSEVKARSSFIGLGGVLLAVHFLSFILYAAVLSPAFQVKHGALTGMQFHLWLATISFPAVIAIAFLERRFKRRLSHLVMMGFLGVWFIAMLYVFLMASPEGKVMLDPSKTPPGTIVK